MNYDAPKNRDYAPDNLNYAPQNQDYAPDNLSYAPKIQDYALRQLNCRIASFLHVWIRGPKPCDMTRRCKMNLHATPF